MLSPIARQYRSYIQAHRTVGCRVTHLFGVPICLGAALALPFRPRVGLVILGFGYIFQIVGHRIFEKNQPVLLTTRDPRIILMAAIMITRDWSRLLRRKRYYTGDFHKTQEIRRTIRRELRENIRAAS